VDRSETTRRDVASLCLPYKPNGPIETINGRFGHLYSVTLGGEKARHYIHQAFLVSSGSAPHVSSQMQ